MRFGGTLIHVIEHILTADPRLGPIYLIKVDLEDAFMRLWFRVEDTPATAFIIPKNREEDEHLVRFHLALYMGFRTSAPFSCMST